MALATDPRAKLREIEAQLREKRDALSEALTERDAARDAYSGTEGVNPDSQEYKDAQTAVERVGDLREDVGKLTDAQVMTLKLLGEAPEDGSGIQRDAGGNAGPEGWNSAHVFENPELQEQLGQMAATKSRMGHVDLGEIASRDAMVADVTGTSNMRRGPYYGIVPQLRRKIRVLDLLPTGTMSGNSLPYTRESGSFTTAAETSEGGLKPEAALTLTDDTATAATIAHWLKIQKQSLSDWPALRSIVDSRLRYGLLRRLEAEVLSGDGTGANITGILNTSGIGTVTYSAGVAVTEQVLRAITTIYLADAEATGVALHPTDWQRALLTKAQYPASGTPTVGSLEYVGGGPFDSTPLSMWGLPCIPTAAIPQGTALVGDFDIGALLLIREGVNVLLSDSDQDDFLRNRITLLAEMRAALPVFRPAAFCTAALGMSTS